MKIRNGFVSNSSSSSFVVVAPKKSVDKVLSGMNDYEKAVINHVKKEQTFVGIPVCVFCGVSGNVDSWEYEFDFDKWNKWLEKNGFDPADAECNTYEVWEDFEEQLKKETKDIISHEEEM